MPPPRGIRRRCFVQLSAGAGLGLMGGAPWANDAPQRRYARVRLEHSDGKPLRPADLEADRSYLFAYPYATTPCFLIDLGRQTPAAGPLQTEAGQSYHWPGGAGPARSIVAFAAICAHQLTHPARAVSFIDYRPEAVSYVDTGKKNRRAPGLIHCCSERSVYDPARGAAVRGGPAKQPLTTITLEHDASRDELFATGTVGGELYERYFEKFGERLKLEYRTSNLRRLTEGSTSVQPLETFSAQRMLCGA